ncbi:signal peptidase I [Alkalihalobacillus sp. LMS39]|uniref:signal peptidase I n=1 Tax=Alkalihalobacillus sp. LMS39 TaxID=2924032 RepID=UPI001FB3E0AC|nr:signal peptidase I [Alkalihalobacillus sp. LMS39]UOE95746.1 signal peptidase I [Alkalihalobacillus sp. LMS39]
MVQKIMLEMISWVKAIVLGFVLAFLLSIFIIQPYEVDGSSMEPTLEGRNDLDETLKGDRVITYKTPYILGASPEFGDVVVIDSRVNEERTLQDLLLDSPMISTLTRQKQKHMWIKRVIGEPGDIIEIKDGVVYRNGSIIEEEYIKEEIYGELEATTVPDDMIFVMGDNRNGSTDSRNIGPVPIDHVIGKVILRYFPFDKIGQL